MDDKIEARINSFMDCVKKHEKEKSIRGQRISACIKLHEEGINKCIFLYESSPLDYWEKWNNYHSASYMFYEHEMRNGRQAGDRSAHRKCMKLESLLLEGLTKFEDLRQEFRGEPIKFLELKCVDSGNESDFVICLKVDNNGTCYAFSTLPDLEEILPHDCHCDWELVDAHS